jgi:lipoprotein Spr
MHSWKFQNKLYKNIFATGISLLLLYSCSVQKHGNASHPPIKKSDANKESSLKFYQQKYAPVLGTSSSGITNLKLYQFIDDWIDAPYKYGGVSKTGVDCSGLSALLVREVYGKEISGSSADIFKQTTPIDEDKLKEGDLVFFKINSSNVSHMGVYLANDKFIHASSHAGVIISDLNDVYYRKYFFEAGRLK